MDSELLFETTEIKDTLCSLLPFQLEYALDDSDFLIYEKSRQVGITWSSGYKVLRRVLTSKTKQDHYWLSRDESLAKEFLTDMLFWIRAANLAYEADVIALRGVTATKITFPNGCNLFVLSSSVDAVIGRRGHFYLDEFAVHKDQKKLIALVTPCLSWGYTLTVFSTHRSKHTFFFEMIKNVKEGKLKARVLKTTLFDAIGDGLIDKINVRRGLAGKEPTTAEKYIENARERAGSEEAFNQEYLCIASDGENEIAIDELKLNNVSFGIGTINEALQPNARRFCGIDIGRHRDLTVCWVADDISKNKNETMLVTREILVIKPQEFDTQEKLIAPFLRKHKPRKCMIDGTNTGAGLAESLARKFSFCEVVRITSKTRPEMISDAINLMDREEVMIPDTKEIEEDFLSVEQYINKWGSKDYWIPSRGDRGHGDRFMSFALMVLAYRTKTGKGILINDAKISNQRSKFATIKRRKRKTGAY